MPADAYDERRVLALKARVQVLEEQLRRLRKELQCKDNAFAKCADLCAFFSKILSNEYVTMERKKGFRLPLGKSLIGPDPSHMHFEWAPEDEDYLDDEESVQETTPTEELSQTDEGSVRDQESNRQSETSKKKPPPVDRPSRLEQVILKSIREVTPQNLQAKDIVTIRDKVVQRLCDDDRNFARYYMSLIVKDMRYLALRRGRPAEKETDESQTPGYHELEGQLFKLYRQLGQHLERDKKRIPHSLQSILEMKEGVQRAMERIIEVLMGQRPPTNQGQVVKHQSLDRSKDPEDLLRELNLILTHKKMDQICARPELLRQTLNDLRLVEIKQGIQVKRMESEVFVLKTHSEQFKGRLEEMRV